MSVSNKALILAIILLIRRSASQLVTTSNANSLPTTTPRMQVTTSNTAIVRSCSSLLSKVGSCQLHATSQTVPLNSSLQQSCICMKNDFLYSGGAYSCASYYRILNPTSSSQFVGLGTLCPRTTTVPSTSVAPAVTSQSSSFLTLTSTRVTSSVIPSKSIPQGTPTASTGSIPLSPVPKANDRGIKSKHPEASCSRFNAPLTCLDATRGQIIGSVAGSTGAVLLGMFALLVALLRKRKVRKQKALESIQESTDVKSVSEIAST
ncbi:hypothetical protein BJ875DRAFT_276868 [Amylocarpus encephaloides]|uniref:Uncharacterized protein n=1 Tax=Amylocarpus encephaloides TaxID=45428 RepID=A0A9P7YLD1_9HELO|nr:hypothetical protein BJ875DRAFT_276868 [Amylocarpus encephaloides]